MCQAVEIRQQASGTECQIGLVAKALASTGDRLQISGKNMKHVRKHENHEKT